MRSGLNDDALDATRSLIGREQAFEGVDEVSRNDIRRKLETYCFDCPLYYDDAVARAHGYRMATSPSALIPLWAMQPYWSPGDPPLFRPGQKEKDGGTGMRFPTPFKSTVNAASEVEFYEPVYPGDRLRGSSKLIEVKTRQTRLGNGAFLTVETTLWKHSGERVTVRRATSFQYDKNPGAESGGDKRADEPATAAPADPNADNPPIDWGHQLRFGDVKVGDEIPPYAVWLSYQRIVMSVAVDRMFSGIHHNRDFAREAGLADIIFNTRGYEMILELTMRRWIGLDGRLRKFGPFRMVSNGHPGDVLVCKAQVTKTEQVDGAGLVSLGLTVDNPRRQGALGEAIVSLPL